MDYVVGGFLCFIGLGILAIEFTQFKPLDSTNSRMSRVLRKFEKEENKVCQKER